MEKQEKDPQKKISFEEEFLRVANGYREELRKFNPPKDETQRKLLELEELQRNLGMIPEKGNAGVVGRKLDPGEIERLKEKYKKEYGLFAENEDKRKQEELREREERIQGK